MIPDNDDNSAVRAPLLSKIEAKKAAIIACKPLGARIVGCRAALNRAQGRRTQAVKSLELAQAALQLADTEAAQLACQLQQLEMEVAPQSEPQQQADSIETMASAMSKIITEMKVSPLVSAQTMSETEQHMANLLKGVRAIVASAAEAAAATPQTASHPQTFVKNKAIDTGIQRRVKGKTLTDDTTFTEGVDTGHIELTDTGAGMSDGPAFR